MTDTPNKPDLSRLKIERQEGRLGGAKARGSLPLYVWIALSVVVTAAVCWLTMRHGGCDPQASGLPAASTSPAASAPAVLRNALNATGYVVAQRQAAVSSKATGRLRELRVKEGDRVEADQIIAVIENEDLVQAVARQEALLETAKARVHYAEAELGVAEIEQKRVSGLVSSRAASLSERDAAQARYRRAVADLAAQQAGVTVAEAALKEAKVTFDYTLIRAPFAGTVLTKNADVGEIVAPYGTSSDARAAVVTIADMESLQVEADVSEANIAKVSLGTPCAIVLDSFPEKTYRGAVDSIVPTVDRAKATVLVKIQFLDKDSSVIPEMSAKVEFQLKE